MQEVHMGDEVPDKPPGSCRFLHSSLTTLRGGAGLSLEELAMPDLDLIKQGEQGLRDRRRRCSRPGPDLRPPWAPVGSRILRLVVVRCMTKEAPAARATSHLNVP